MSNGIDLNHEVTVPEMLMARDHRVDMQRELIDAFRDPVVCFMLNIPGPHKVDDDFLWAFDRGINSIKEAFRTHDIIINKEVREVVVTGCVYYASVHSDAIDIKKAMCEIEEADRIGRIFDIDVLRTDGSKVSREEFDMGPRKCLMCEREAHICARNRSHTVKEMIEEIHKIIENTRKTV